jgi:hypothetical protein
MGLYGYRTLLLLHIMILRAVERRINLSQIHTLRRDVLSQQGQVITIKQGAFGNGLGGHGMLQKRNNRR